MADSIDHVIDAGVRGIPDWPAPGVTFRDITPLCADPVLLRRVVSALASAAEDMGPVDAVLGIEARGFIFAPSLALSMDAGFVPVRKQGKLPASTISTEFELEYGTAAIEMHADALRPGMRVLVVDDILATGGTLHAVATLVEKAGAEVAGYTVIAELAGLSGRARLGDSAVHALRVYEA